MLAFSLLGQARIWQDNVPLSHFRSKKEMALLFYLAHTGQPHTREHLADLLWEGRSTAHSLRNLRTVLSRTRRHIGSALITTRDWVALAPDEVEHVDSRTLLDALVSARRPAGEGTRALLRNALQLYGGSFLQTFTLRQAPPAFEEWVRCTRQKIRQELSTAYRIVVAHAYEQGDLAQGLRDVHHWLQVNEWDEVAHGYFIRLLRASNREQEALAHYQACRQRFHDELGVDVTPTLAPFFSIPSETPRRTSLTLARRNHNLPASYDSFVGRGEEQQELLARLAQPWCRLLTITGGIGVGKTRLALAIAQTLHPLYADGAWWVGLDVLERDDPDISEAIAVEIASTLSLPLAENDLCVQQLVRALQNRHMMLVLDTFEPFLPAGKECVARILQSCPKVQIIITSRQPLNMRGENVFHVRGLQHPNVTADDEMSNAMALFVARAAEQHRSSLSDDEMACVRRICERLEGVPLAIELAARLTRSMPLHHIESELAQGFAVLERAFQDVPSRATSLHQAFAESWALLPVSLQQVLAALAVCQGGCTSAAAAAIANATTGDLVTLCDMSLLHYERNAQRYVLPAIVQTFAREKISPENTALFNHAQYYLAQLAQLPLPFSPNGQKHIPANLDADGQNFQLAWQTALEQQWFDELNEAFAAFAAWLQAGRLFRKTEALMRMTAQHAHQWGEAGHVLALRAELMCVRTQILAGEYERAIQNLEKALWNAQQFRNAWAEGAGYSLWAFALQLSGNDAMAALKFAQASQIAQSLHDEQNLQWYREIVALVDDRYMRDA